MKRDTEGTASGSWLWSRLTLIYDCDDGRMWSIIVMVAQSVTIDWQWWWPRPRPLCVTKHAALKRHIRCATAKPKTIFVVFVVRSIYLWPWRSCESVPLFQAKTGHPSIFFTFSHLRQRHNGSLGSGSKSRRKTSDCKLQSMVNDNIYPSHFSPIHCVLAWLVATLGRWCWWQQQRLWRWRRQ